MAPAGEVTARGSQKATGSAGRARQPSSEFGPAAAPAEPASLDCASSFDAWLAAHSAAGREKSLDSLESRASDLAASCPERWEPPWILGQCRYDRGDRGGALESFREALARAERAGSEEGIAASADSVARRLHRDLTRFDEAEALYRRSITSARSAGRRDLESWASGNLAGLLLQSGRYAAAERTQAAVVEALAALGDPRLPTAMANQALILMELGDAKASRTLFARVYQDEKTHPALRARCAWRLGTLDAFADDWGSAGRYFEEARLLHPESSGGVDLQEGRLALRRDAPEEALVLLERASETLTNPISRLAARQNLAAALLRTGRPEEAENLLYELRAEADERKADGPRWVTRSYLGQVYLEQERIAEAVLSLEQAVEILEAQRQGLSPGELGLRFLAQKADLYVNLAAAHALTGGDEAVEPALRALERAHARALRSTLDPDREGRDSPDIATLRASLREGEVLLDYLLGTRRGVVVALSRESSEVKVLGGLDDIGEDLERYRAALQRPLRSAEARLDPGRDLERSLDAGERVYRALLAPVEATLLRARRVYVVPDRDLALLPLSALPIPPESALSGRRTFLGGVLETAILPLASAPRPWTASAGEILLAGDPLPGSVGDTFFATLPSAGEELDEIETIWSRRRVVRLDRDRLRLAALEETGLDRFEIIHLATHAVASSRDPERCAVILSEGESLPLDRVIELRLGEPLVVLSACSTGEGEILPGEGVVGLAWAFLRARAGGLVVSLWSVEDQATARLMRYLHESLRDGRDVVAALAQARRRVAEIYEHPVYWAAFEVVLRP